MRIELESVGITPALFNERRERIIERLLEAIDDGDPAEDIGEELSDTTQESTEERSVAADSIDRITSAAGTQRTTSSTASPPATRPIRGPSRIAKLSFRITSNNNITAAAKQGNESIVQELLQRGANADLKDKNGRTPLSRATNYRYEAVVQLLLETGKVDVGSKDNKYGRTPLSRAAENGNKAVVQLLLKTGKVDINSKDIYGETALFHAAYNGHETIVKLELETGKVYQLQE